MKITNDSPDPASAPSFVSTIGELLDRDLVHDTEVVMAFLALWMLKDVEQRRMTRDAADQLFTLLDVYLTDQRRKAPLSAEAQELLFEGELFHHYGEEDGPDPGHLRSLAFKILGRAKQRR